jgi:hypothetical protein
MRSDIVSGAIFPDYELSDVRSPLDQPLRGLGSFPVRANTRQPTRASRGFLKESRLPYELGA